MNEQTEKTDSKVIAFRAGKDLIDATEAAAVAEGLSRADVSRRALIRDLTRGGWFPGTAA